eukprot:m.138093 g.138093  ORF g.138093 m.138093 type:complete len:106 (-) comp14008_c0_seq6:1120-1437(-)
MEPVCKQSTQAGDTEAVATAVLESHERTVDVQSDVPVVYRQLAKSWPAMVWTPDAFASQKIETVIEPTVLFIPRDGSARSESDCVSRKVSISQFAAWVQVKYNRR